MKKITSRNIIIVLSAAALGMTGALTLDHAAVYFTTYVPAYGSVWKYSEQDGYCYYEPVLYQREKRQNLLQIPYGLMVNWLRKRLLRQMEIQ